MTSRDDQSAVEPGSSEFAEHQPKTAVVLALLAAAAVIFSYLTSYCLINALVATEVLTRWPPGHDPRPKYFAAQFIGMMMTFLGIGTAARWISRRQIARIEEMERD